MTGSLIAKQIGPDAYRTIFCQIEGHLESQGDMLVKHFDTPEKVDELLSLGDLYVLYPQLTPDPARKHSMDDRQQNVTVAYQRDWGETDMDAQILTLEELDSPDGIIEFVYIFDMDHQWKYAVFVGTDKAGKVRHIHKRSTAAQGGFKGNAPGSEPEYSFHWSGKGDVLYLFEAPIDMLSFISMFKHCWKSQSYAASCGVSDKVLWQMLKDGPHIKKVYICFDNDEPGQQAAQRISREMTEKNIWHEIYPPEHKDWNEDLLQWRKGQA